MIRTVSRLICESVVMLVPRYSPNDRSRLAQVSTSTLITAQSDILYMHLYLSIVVNVGARVVVIVYGVFVAWPGRLGQIVWPIRLGILEFFLEVAQVAY